MGSIKKTALLFTIIIVEGYLVLSTELLAIRQTIPYIGSGTDTISIIIAAILMPLALGYQNGGQYKTKKFFGRVINIRSRLILNITIAATFLFFGLGYLFMDIFFDWISYIGIKGRIYKTSIFCIVFLIVPVYLLGQTVPLISNFFTKAHLPRITGKILFYSTLGSFIGAIFSTLVLMATLGVHHTLTLNFVLMAILVIMLNKKLNSRSVYYMVTLALFALLLNSDSAVKSVFPAMRANNQYSIIQAVISNGGRRELMINGNHSSSYNDFGHKHGYIKFAEEVMILPITNANPARDILVIGAGGFTFGHNDTNNSYTYVDIDKDLKPISERYILKEPIGENKTFVAEPARAFLYNTDTKYDAIYLDAYLGRASVPEHLITQEFFTQVKDHIKDGGIIMGNFIASPNFNTAFSRNLDNTLRSVFPHVSRHAIHNHYNIWRNDPSQRSNIAYIYRHHDDYGVGHIYTDNKNTVFYDKPAR